MLHRIARLVLLLIVLSSSAHASDLAVLLQLESEALAVAQQTDIELSELKAELQKADTSPVRRSQLEQLNIDLDSAKYQSKSLASRLAKRNKQLERLAADAPATWCWPLAEIAGRKWPTVDLAA